MKKRRFLIGILATIVILIAVPMTAFATGGGSHYDLNVDVGKDCTNVYVSASPAVYWEDNSGQSQIKWVPGAPSGIGTYPWGVLQTSMNGTVSATWTKYTSNDWGNHWTVTSQTHTESGNWSANRPGSCQITFCHVAGLGQYPANYVTLTTSIQAALGHFFNNGTPKAGHELDYLGACQPPPVCEWNPNIFADDPDCQPPYETCDETIALDPIVQWDPWSPWVYDPETGLEGHFHYGLSITIYVDSRNQQHECSRETVQLYEEESREVDYPAGALVPSQTCEPVPGSWGYQVIVPEGASAELISGALGGEWLDPYAPEDNEAFVPTFVFTWDTGYSEEVIGEVIDKNLECLQCRVTELYGMTLYTDPNAPAVYWEGTFGFPACPVIHLDGEVPAGFRVTQICSICPESGLEGGYIFHGIPVGEGRVLRYDCYGHESRYFYLNQDWDELVRFDFDADGTRRSCRVDGCVDWINETAGIVPPE